MRIPAAVFLASTCLIFLSGTADAFSARRGVRVNPVDTQAFEAIARSAGSAGDYWCGAGDYAQRALGAAWTTRIYILRGRGPSVTTERKSAVQFTLDPNAVDAISQVDTFFLNSMKAGDSMSVQQAQSYCAQVLPVRP